MATFDCNICLEKNLPIEKGFIYNLCQHIFCKPCLVSFIKYNETNSGISCPSNVRTKKCDSILDEYNVKLILNDLDSYKRYKESHFSHIQARLNCFNSGCQGHIDELTKCNICQEAYCLDCKKNTKICNDSPCESKTSLDLLNNLAKDGTIIKCPECGVFIEKYKGACQFVRCYFCRLDICWLTKQPRWGPNGKGDTSAGCQCGLNDIKCHPDCVNCH